MTLRNNFQNATGVCISTHTVRNRLHDAGIGQGDNSHPIDTTTYQRTFAMGAGSCNKDH